MSRYFKAEIEENRVLNENHNLLSLKTPHSLTAPSPGQFFMLEVSKGRDPLLKRAFSLFRRTEEGFEILYRIKGRGTAILRDMKAGTAVEVLGPLGNGYPPPLPGEVPLIIAGGIGVASVFPLAQQLLGDAFVFYGARGEKELFLTDQLQKIYRELVVCTDDGSCGVRGNVVDVLHKFMDDNPLVPGGRVPVIYACGPHPMLKGIAASAAAYGIKAYVSLEEHMACGVGACLGCVVKTKAGYKRVCKEGPIFDSEEIVW